MAGNKNVVMVRPNATNPTKHDILDYENGEMIDGSIIEIAGFLSQDTGNLIHFGSDRKIYLNGDDLISYDSGNSLVKGSDGKLYVSVGSITGLLSGDAGNIIRLGRDGKIYLSIGDLVSAESENGIGMSPVDGKLWAETLSLTDLVARGECNLIQVDECNKMSLSVEDFLFDTKGQLLRIEDCKLVLTADDIISDSDEGGLGIGPDGGIIFNLGSIDHNRLKNVYILDNVAGSPVHMTQAQYDELKAHIANTINQATQGSYGHVRYSTAADIENGNPNSAVSAADLKAVRDMIKETPTTAQVFYVRTDGNDQNDGRTNTPGGAFKTLNGGFTKIIDTQATSAFIIQMMVQEGTFDGTGVDASALSGAGVEIIGTGPGSTTIRKSAASGDGTCIYCGGGNLTISNLTVSGISVADADVLMVSAAGGSIVDVGDNVTFSAVHNPGHPWIVAMYANGGTLQTVGSGIVVTGSFGGGSVFQAGSGGSIALNPAFQAPRQTITFSGVSADRSAYVTAGNLTASTVTIASSGGGINYKYYVTANGTITLNNPIPDGEDFFPGTGPGVADNGGQYIVNHG